MRFEAAQTYYPNFDWLRLLLAIQVVALHAGITERVFVNPVPAFITISGFVVLGSLQRRSMGEFFVSRTLRVLPLLVVTFIAVGALHGWQAMLRNIEYWLWPKGPEPTNPVVWSLLYEEVYYCLLAVLFVAGSYRRLWIPVALALATMLIAIYTPTPFSPRMWFYLGGAFFLGNAAYLIRDRIRKNINPWIAATALIVMASSSFLTPYTAVMRQGFLDYACFSALIVFAVAGHALPKLKIDLSYSLYLIHCLVRDRLWGHVSYGTWTFFAAMLILSLPLCLLSWYAIEKPSLSLKRFLRRTNSHGYPNASPTPDRLTEQTQN